MNTMYYILGALLVVYLLIGMFNKRQGKRRKSRSFMEGQRLRERKGADKEAGPRPKQ
jgi:hypothetical protein